ncbi:MAG: PilZ domain-containing protein [Sphingobium sp.]|nr:PilZ domain-containing protein [Sphingobium sp.]
MDRDPENHVPREPREPCNIEVVMIDENGQEILGRLGNISGGGFMAECEEKLPIGAIISVTLPERGPVRGEIRWALGWKFGAQILPA